jgi:hypothetical protein
MLHELDGRPADVSRLAELDVLPAGGARVVRRQRLPV